jgi:hypothetical protein
METGLPELEQLREDIEQWATRSAEEARDAGGALGCAFGKLAWRRNSVRADP